MNLFIVAFAVILLGLKLPSFMSRLGMSKKDKVAFVGIAFSMLLLVWLAAHVFSMSI